MKKKVAISACLLGQAVRYDGQSKLHRPILNYLSDKVELVPFCPEVGIGLPIPREKIYLCYNSFAVEKNIRVKEVDDLSKDYTQQLTAYARDFIKKHPDLSAIILKSKSPSCGLLSTPIFDHNEQKDEQKDETEIKKGSGQFAYTIKTEFQSVLLIEETSLENRVQCREFLRQLTNP